MNAARWLALPLVWLLLCCAARAAEFTGLVSRVSDGDTLWVEQADGERHKVRLLAIDAPELAKRAGAEAQPYAAEAQALLAELTLRQEVRITWTRRDRYGRILGQAVRVSDGLDVQRELLSRGAVWVYSTYRRSRTWLPLEREAREARRGLWAAEAEPIPPWDWRRTHR